MEQGRALLEELSVEKEKGSTLRKEAGNAESRLLEPELTLYCGDVLIECRWKYLGCAGSLEMLGRE